MDKPLYKKSGQIAAPAVGDIIILIVGVGVSVLVLIFVGSLGGQTFQLVESDIDKIGNNVVTGERFLTLNGTAVDLTNVPLQAGTLVFTNGSDVVQQVGNYTITSLPSSSITFINNAFNNTNLSAAYTWGDLSIRNSIKGSAIAGFAALEQTGEFLPLIVLAVVITLVLGLILSFTVIGNKSGGQGSVL